MQGYHKAIFFIVTAVAFIPSLTFAALTRSYEGCFERPLNSTDLAVEVFMKHPSCTITLTNADTRAAALQIHVINIDPHYYHVVDATGTEISTTREATALTFTPTVAPGQTTTYTIQLWEDVSNKTDFWFAAISDTQTRDGNEVPNQIAIDVMDQLELISPPFVTNSGDVIGGSTDANEHEYQIELYDELFQEFAGIHLPIPGDHDVRRPIADYYEKYFGDTPFTFVYGSTRLIGINTVETLETEGIVSAETMAWLEQVLAAATEKHIVLYMQHPLIQPTWSLSLGIRQQAQREQLATLFVQYGVEVVIVGDAHGYEYTKMDSEDFPGLNGSFYQLDAAGAGGEFFSYTNGDHFFTLVHVTPDGITHAKLDWSTVNLQLEEITLNDGTTTRVQLKVKNVGTMAVPYMRVRVSLDDATTENVYALTSRGEVLPVRSEVVEGVRRGYVELEQIDPETTITLDIKEVHTLLLGTKQRVSESGIATVASTDTRFEKETELSIVSATAPVTVNVETWKTHDNERTWISRTTAGNTITYEVSGLKAKWPYHIVINNKQKQRVVANGQGVLQFTMTQQRSRATLSVVPAPDLLPTQIGVLPYSSGGPQLQVFADSGKLLRSAFVYSKHLVHGFESRWINVDDDAALELVTVPQAGAVSSVKLFDDDGTLLATMYPFGNGFTGGLTITTGDIDGDGDQECIVAPLSQQRPIVYVYSYDAEAQDVEILDLFEVYDRGYTNGLSMTMGDANDDGKEELLIGPREGNHDLSLYTYNTDTNQVEVAVTSALPSPYTDGKGVTLAAGDLDFNGTDAFVMGSLNGSDVVSVITAKQATVLTLMTQRHVFSSGYTGGVRVLVGNVEGTAAEEVLVLSQQVSEQTMLASFALKEKRLKPVAQIQALRNNTSVMQAALVDGNQDQQLEVVIGPTQGKQKIRVYRYRKDAFAVQRAFRPYQSNFSGGVNLTY